MPGSPRRSLLPPILLLLAPLAVGAPGHSAARADDWPQWMGPARDGVWRERGIVGTIPAGGLPVKWRAEVKGGYSGPAVAAGRVYLMDYDRTSGDLANDPGTRTALAGRERILCLDAATGRLLWKHEYDRDYSMSYASGPRCTPTVFDGMVHALGAEGDLTCLDAALAWRGDPKSAIYCANSTPFIADGTIYGCDCETGFLTAADLATGRRLWETGRPTMGDRRGRHGTAFLVRQGDGPTDDRTWLASETGDLILARLTPAAYEELGRARLLAPTNECFGREVVWSHPAFADCCVFARNDRELVCVSLAE